MTIQGGVVGRNGVGLFPKTNPTFEDFWHVWPRKAHRKEAVRAWGRLSLKNRSAAVLGVQRHVSYWKISGTQTRYIPLPATFLNGEHWEDELPGAETDESVEDLAARLRRQDELRQR